MMRRLAGDRGAAAAELALITPLLVLLLFGIVEAGRGYHAKVTVTHAAREGVRALAVAEDAALDRAETAVATATPGLPVELHAVAVCPNAQDMAELTVSHTFAFMTPLGAAMDLFGGSLVDGPLTITAEGTMRCGG